KPLNDLFKVMNNSYQPNIESKKQHKNKNNKDEITLSKVETIKSFSIEITQISNNNNDNNDNNDNIDNNNNNNKYKQSLSTSEKRWMKNNKIALLLTKYV